MRKRHGAILLAVIMACSAAAAQEQTVAELLEMCDSLLTTAQYDSAVSVGRRTLSLAEERYGPVDSMVARALIQLGLAHFYKAQLGEAEPLWSRALAIREEIYGPDHPLTAHAMGFMGLLYDEAGSPARAVPVFERAEAIFEKSGAAYPRKHADCTHNLAIAYMRLGRYDDAAAAYEHAIELYEIAEGPDGEGVGACLSNLSNIYYDTGDYANALATYQRALRILEATQGENHPDVARVVENIANVYLVLGQYDEAETYLKRALEIKKATLAARHPEIANSKANLANLYVAQGKYAEAEPLLLDALSIYEEEQSPDYVDLAYILSNLAKLNTELGRQDEAEAYFLRALEIREKSLGKFHTRVAVTLNNLGVFYMDTGRYDEAMRCFLRALDIDEKVLTPIHPSVADVLGNIAGVCRHEGKADSAFALYSRACAIHQENLIHNGRALPEADVLSYSFELNDATSRYLSAYFDMGSTDPAVLADLADAVLRGKGQVSDVLFDRTRAIVTETDPGVRAVADSLTRLKDDLSQLFVQGPGLSISKFNSQVKSLSSLIAAEEAELVERSASFKRWRETKNVSLERVQAALPANATLVEYFLYQRSRLDPVVVEVCYAALAFRKDAEPLIVDLGLASEIDPLIAKYRRHFGLVADLGAPTSGDLDEYRVVAGDIRKKVWTPVAGFIGESDVVVICPDGALSLVSFAALPDGSGGYLIEKHALHYLSSGRDVLRFEEAVEPASGLLALGDPDYDASRDATHGDTALARGALPNCDDFRNTVVHPLPGSRREVEQIAAAWAETDGGPETILLGSEATEGAFKSNATGKRVIHLATHGYYVSGGCGAGSDNEAPVAARGFDNPLLLSGLFLAGANRRGEAPESRGDEDGVLTAFEVSSMDLRGCALVVLSACETGLGEPEAGEGVYGLRRAFHMAGARTVVSALWRITDQDAVRFAGRLYSRDDRMLPLRLRDLQLSLIEDLRSEGLTDHPFSWAAFIAQGDWRL